MWWNSKIMLYGYSSFTVYIKTGDTHENIANYVETSFDTFNYELDRPLHKGKN